MCKYMAKKKQWNKSKNTLNNIVFNSLTEPIFVLPSLFVFILGWTDIFTLCSKKQGSIMVFIMLQL